MCQKIKQDKSIGPNLKKLRKEHELTQDKVSEKLAFMGIDMSRDFYAHIESGAYNIRVSELSALRQIFNCSFDDIFAGF